MRLSGFMLLSMCRLESEWSANALVENASVDGERDGEELRASPWLPWLVLLPPEALEGWVAVRAAGGSPCLKNRNFHASLTPLISCMVEGSSTVVRGNQSAQTMWAQSR